MFAVYLPSGLSWQGRNPAITVSAILLGQSDHIRNQPILICPASRPMPLCWAVLLQYLACPAFGYFQLFMDTINTLAPTCGTQKFSLTGLRLDQLIQRQVGYRTAQQLILFRNTLQFPQLFDSHTAVLFALAIVRLLGDTHLSNRIDPVDLLSCKYVNLAKLGDNLFRFMSFDTHYRWTRS